MRKTFTAAFAGAILSWATPIWADQLNIVTSIQPIGSLVSAVAGENANVTILVPPNASPHNFTLKPSAAKSLQDADVIFWIDENLEVFSAKANATLPKNAEVIALAEKDGVVVLDSRELKLSVDDHHDEHDDHSDHGDEHHEEGHNDHEHEDSHDEKHEDHDDHGAHDDHEGHDHGAHDLHIWLDPENAKNIVRVVKLALATADPANATSYKENANLLDKKLDALLVETERKLTNVKSKSFVTFHDAYQYYERRFDLNNVGIVTINPEIKPGAKRLVELKEALEHNDVSCLFSEPQFDAKLVQLAVEGTNVQTAELDPLGAKTQAGPDQYFELIDNLTDSLVECLTKAK